MKMAEEYFYEKPKESKKSNKKMLVILLIIIAVSISSYFLFFSSPSGIKDCGKIDYGSIISSSENKECFRNAAKNCTSAKLITAASGSLIPFSILSEIRGFADDNTSCLVYDKTFDEKNGLSTLEDNCKVPIEILSKIDVSPDLRYKYCSGTLSEWFKQNLEQVLG